MSGPRLRRGVARLILRWRMEVEEVDPVLDDLDEMRTGWAERWGRTVATLRWWIEVGRYAATMPTGRHGRGEGRGTMDRWMMDLRWTLRRMARRPLPTFVIVATLGLGVGASTSVYTVIDNLVIRPLPFEESDRLIRIHERVTYPGQPPRETVMAARNFDALRDRTRAFGDVSAARYRSVSLGGDGEPERVGGIAATWNHFSVLGAEPMLGRAFRPEEDASGRAAPVVVLSHELWTRRFGRDPDVLGRDMVMNGRPHTVIGVAAPGFRYPYAAEVWFPMGLDPTSGEYDDRNLNVSARLVDDASVESARSDLDRVASALEEELAETNRGVDFVVTPIREEILEGTDRQAAALLWGALFVLLIGAANVASMVLARMHGDEREVSLVVALGADRGDLVRRIVVESGVVAALAASVGLFLAWLAAGPMAALSPLDDLGPYFSSVGMNGRVVSVAIVLAGGAALLTGLPAAFRSTRAVGALGARAVGGRGRRSTHFLDLLVAGEVAVAVLLLTGAGLMGRSLQNQWSVDPGVEMDGLLTVGMSPSTAGYPEDAERIAFVSAALDEVRRLPGVTAAGVTNMNPFRDQGWGVGLWPEGRASDDPGARFIVNHRAVTPGFLEATDSRILAGRDLAGSDGPDDPSVALLSEDAAGRLFPDGDPVGQRVRRGSVSEEGTWITVVGVVEDVADYGDVLGSWYRPLAQAPEEFNTGVLEIFLATDGDPSTVFTDVRRALRNLDPGLPLFSLEPVVSILRFERRTETFTGVLLGIFALLGLTLSVVGIHGVLSYTLGRRRRELGLRKALGARPSELVAALVRRTFTTVCIGLGVGVLGAVLLTRFMDALLVGVDPLQFEVFAAMAAATFVVAMGATLLPARRAVQLDARTVLAEE